MLRIVHETVYRYRIPVRFGPHRLVLRPREGHDVQVQAMRLEIYPAHRLEWRRDMFGNCVAIARFLDESDELRIRSEVELRQNLPFPLESEGAFEPYPVSLDPKESVIARAYLERLYPDEAEALAEWTADVREYAASEPQAENVVATLARKIREQIGYRRREEPGVQTPLETVRTAGGSCRDMATLMMECLRGLGFPARFASGYLHCAAGEAGHASTHAWAEAYLPHTGWMGWDATSGRETTVRHVVTGVSNHPRGVMPISGTFVGENLDYLGLEVSVVTRLIEPQGAPAAEPRIHVADSGAESGG